MNDNRRGAVFVFIFFYVLFFLLFETDLTKITQLDALLSSIVL